MLSVYPPPNSYRFLWGLCLCVYPPLFFKFLGVGWDWVHLVRRPLTGPLYQPRMIDDWMWSSRCNENWQEKPKYSEKPCPSALCPPQIPHDLTWARTRAAVVKKPETKSLSYGTDVYHPLLFLCGPCIEGKLSVYSLYCFLGHYQELDNAGHEAMLWWIS
jgi:hypothetical protein